MGAVLESAHENLLKIKTVVSFDHFATGILGTASDVVIGPIFVDIETQSSARFRVVSCHLVRSIFATLDVRFLAVAVCKYIEA